MNKKDLVKAFEKEIEKISKEKLEEFVEDIYGRIVVLTPVDTGNLRSNFYKEKNKDRIKIGNHAPYANNILIFGRRKINGKLMGSEQLPDGILPYIKSWIKEAENK